MEEDEDVPIIFGRPFLATSDALIGVKDRIITFRVNREEVHFDLAFASKHVNDNDVCYSMDVIDDCIDEFVCESLSSNDAMELELVLKHVFENESYFENFSKNGVMKKDSYF